MQFRRRLRLPPTEGILGDDGAVAVQGVGVALLVVGADAELVLLAGLQAGHLGVRGVAVHARARHPSACKGTECKSARTHTP